MAKAKPAKPVHVTLKLQVPGGEANPQPPVGPALGQHGVNIMEFVKRFNDATQDMKGTIVPVVITVYRDKSFDFIMKSPPASALLKQAAEIAKGASNALTEKVGRVTPDHLREIARRKMADLNAFDEEAAMRQIAGTARSMGIEVVEAGAVAEEAPEEGEKEDAQA